MRLSIWSLGLIAAITACGSKKSSSDSSSSGSVTGNGGGSTKSVPTGTIALTVEAVGDNSQTSGSGLALVSEHVISFSPTKYIFPVADITISNSKKTNTLPSDTAASGTGTDASSLTDTAGASIASTTTNSAGGTIDPNSSKIYKCAGTTPADCNIDLMDNDAMKTAFGTPAAVPVGTYDTISYSVACTPGVGTNGGGGLVIGVQATVTLNGTTYYTTSKDTVLSTDAADLGPAPALITSCGGQGSSFTLPTPIDVAADQTVQVSMFLASKNISWASTDVGSPGLGGCVNGKTTNYVCTSLPTVVPAAGTFKPEVEIYTIDVTGQGTGQVGIISDDKGVAIGAYLTRLYTDTTTSAAIWDAGVQVFKKNADGTFDIASSTDDGAAGARCEFPAFQRANHSGTLKASGASESYTATKD